MYSPREVRYRRRNQAENMDLPGKQKKEMCEMGNGESGRSGRKCRAEGGNVGRCSSILEAFVKWYENLVKMILMNSPNKKDQIPAGHHLSPNKSSNPSILDHSQLRLWQMGILEIPKQPRQLQKY